MSVNASAPWHRASWDRFIQEGLPELLADRLSLAGYHVTSTGSHTCALKVILQGKDGEVEVDYPDVPQPDETGLFKVDGYFRVVVPAPTAFDLEAAEIRCVGELLQHFVADRLGEAPENFPWDAELVREWLPLDGWIRAFLTRDPTSQLLQRTNWLDMYTHLRRITFIPILGQTQDSS